MKLMDSMFRTVKRKYSQFVVKLWNLLSVDVEMVKKEEERIRFMKSRSIIDY